MIKRMFAVLRRKIGDMRVDATNQVHALITEKEYLARAREVEAMGEAVISQLDRETVAVLGDTLFGQTVKESKVGDLAHREVFKIRYRPDRDYYKMLKKPLPKPENPRGCDAAGVELTFGLYRGISLPDRVIGPDMILSFEVWGEEERRAFQRMFARFSPEFLAFLEQCPLKLWTARVFRRVDALKGSRFTRKLERYLVEDDDESCFHLDMSIKANTALWRVGAVFPILATLYAGTLAGAVGHDTRVFERLQTKLVKAESRPGMPEERYH